MGKKGEVMSEPNALVFYPSLAEALDELVEEYGLDLVEGALDELIEERERE